MKRKRDDNEEFFFEELIAEGKYLKDETKNGGTEYDKQTAIKRFENWKTKIKNELTDAAYELLLEELDSKKSDHKKKKPNVPTQTNKLQIKLPILPLKNQRVAKDRNCTIS
jgi:hypothetical protein